MHCCNLTLQFAYNINGDMQYVAAVCNKNSKIARFFSLMPNVVVQTVYLLIIGKVRNCVVCNV